jgi:two-component system NarL family response regulator
MPNEGSPVRVLVVEDHPALALALRELLERDDRLIVLDLVGTGADLLSHPHLCDADVILTDVHLPDFDGRTLPRELRMRNCDARVVVMSGSGDEKTAGEALASGADAFLDKGALHGEIGDGIVAVAEGRSERIQERRSGY